MKKSIILSVVVLSGAMAFGKTLFNENFRFYNDHPTAFVDDPGIVVNEDGVWDFIAFAECRPSRDCELFVRDLALPAEGVLGEVVFALQSEGQKVDKKTKELSDKGAGAGFDFVFKDGAKAQRLAVAADSLAGFPCEFIRNGGGGTIAFRLKGKEIEIFHTPNRADLKSLGKKTLDFAPKAVNIGLRKGQGVDIHNVRLATMDDAFTRHPVEKHFADFRSLTQQLKGGKVAKGDEKIELKDGRFRIRLRLNATNGVAKLTACGVTDEKVKGNALVGTISSAGRGDYAISTPFEEAFWVKPAVQPYAACGECGTFGAVPQWEDIQRDWGRLPASYEHILTLDFERRADGSWQVLRDGSLAGGWKPLKTATGFVFEPGAGVSYLIDKPASEGVDTSRYFPIDLSANPRAKAMADGVLKGVKPGLQTVGGAPVRIAEPMDSADVAICKFAKGNWALEVEQYFGRHPALGYPSAIHYRVPAAFYHTAHVVFALDPDPAKDKVLTVRLARLGESGGNLRGDTVLDFSKGVPASCRKIGEVALKGKTVPLYYAEVKLEPGPVMDYVFKDAHIDFEFVGKCWETTQQLDYSMKPDPNSDSAFNVFGVTLEKAPFRAEVRQATPGNVFTVDEKERLTTMRIISTKPASGTLVWRAYGLDGETAFEGKKAWTAAAANVTNDVVVSLGDAKPGFYNLDWTFLDAAGAKLFTHKATFGIMPELGRKVSRKESPYCTWWFGWNHGSTGDDHVGGPLLHKAGIRKSTWHSPSKENREKYDLGQAGALWAPHRTWGHVTTNDEFVGEYEYTDPTDTSRRPRKIKTKDVNEYMIMTISNELKGVDLDACQPHLLYWHESAPGSGIPEELLGLPVPKGLTYRGARFDAVWLNRLSEILHKHFPYVKLQPGNSTHSTGAVKGPMRAGAKVSVYDCVGIETPSQTIMPERLIDCGLQGMHLPLDTAEAISGERIKANGTWEFVYRTSRDLGELKQAEWYMRDVLISLAHDFFLIGPGVFFDCQTGYYDGLWGGAGLTYRVPWVYPKPAYVAYGVLTKALDGVKLSRQLDTGSTTVYALEFRRCDGLYATALWCAKGAVDFKVTAEKGFLGLGGGGKVVKMLGEESELPAGESIVKGGTSPCYLITKKPLKAVTIAGRSYPREDAIAAEAKLAGARPNLTDANEVVVKPDMAYASRHHDFMPYLVPSDDFVAKTVEDPEKGKCVELTLKPAKEKPANKFVDRYTTRFTTLTFKEPKVIPGEPSVIGVWVKGDSNWGQIRFEIEDANGEVFRNLSTGSWWICDIMDWPGNLAVNFDGWSYVCCSLVKNSWIREVSPGFVQEQWAAGGYGDKKIQYPIKVRSITVGVNRAKLGITDFSPATNVLRFRDVGGTADRR